MARELDELRNLLVGPEQRLLEDLRRRVETAEVTAEEIAERLPEAIALRSGRDQQLGRALAPTVENALRESVRRNPREIATAIFPILGPAIRKAIAETMAGLVRSINVAIEHSLSIRGLRWRIESWGTGVPYAQIVLKHALVYRVEQLFLIHADTGLLLTHVAPPDLPLADADLISSMLTAIQDFVADSFRTAEVGGRLRTFSVGELTVMVESGPLAVLAAVVRGQPPDSLLRKLQDSLETVHVQFGSRLTDFDGDADPFADARPLLASCLETVLTTDRPRRGSTVARLAPILIAAGIVVVLAGRYLEAEVRWRRAVARLEAEPGIVVVEADRGFGGARLRGLRDPLAADPATVLAGQGVDPTGVQDRWEPYLSLEPAVVLARARQLLGAPASVALALEEGAVIGSGTAPIDWLGARSSASAPPPGATRVDLAAITPTLPAGLEATRAGLAAARVLFPVGSPEVDGRGDAVIQAAAAGFRSILDAATAAGYRVELAVVGRTDPTGSDAANQALSRFRAEAVARRLEARGIPRESLVPVALGISRPVTGGRDEAERAALNRSVSFDVRLLGPRRDQP